MTMAKTKRTPCQPLVSTDPRGLAAGITATRPSPCHFQPPRARCPQAYLPQDQRGERSRSLISTIAAAKATKPADDFGDDDDGNDKEDVRSIVKKGNDGGDDEQGVEEDGMSAAAKAAKPGGDDSKDDDDDKEGWKGVKKRISGLKGGKKHVIDDGDNDNSNDNDIVVWQKGGKKQVIDDDNDDDDNNEDKEGQKGVKKCIMGQKGGKNSGIDNGDNDDEDKDNEEVQKGGKKWGGKDDDPSASMGSGSSSSLSNEVVTWVSFNLSHVN